jgi:hypothetical protein
VWAELDGAWVGGDKKGVGSVGGEVIRRGWWHGWGVLGGGSVGGARGGCEQYQIWWPVADR